MATESTTLLGMPLLTNGAMKKRHSPCLPVSHDRLISVELINESRSLIAFSRQLMENGKAIIEYSRALVFRLETNCKARENTRNGWTRSAHGQND